MKRCALSISALTFVLSSAGETTVYGAEGALPRDVKAADGYTVSLAVPPELVERPVEAYFDDKGRLYVTEVTGTNDPPEVQLKNTPHRVLRLTDSNNDGVFDTRTVFADKLGFPEGVLWHGGAVYVAAPPQIWKFTDKDDDGVADTREVWFDGKTLTGCANDLHGPYAGPDGLLYWCKGAFAEQTHDLPGYKGWKSRAAHVFRMKPDGTEFDVVFTAGMDNPVGLAWTPEGDMIVSGTFLQHPGDGKRDGLIHAVRGGLWGKDHDVLDGHLRTGPLLPPMTHLGPAAPAGMIRYGRDLLVAQFNLRKVSRHVLEPLGSTWQTTDSDFLTCDDPDFHPTDVLQSPDGSVLVVDTGGWYKLCCPTSQVAKPQVTGAIYRMRKTGGEVPVACSEPRWRLAKPEDLDALLAQVQSPNLHVRRMAVEKLGQLPAKLWETKTYRGGWNKYLAPLLQAACAKDADRFLEHAITYALLLRWDMAAESPDLNLALETKGAYGAHRAALYVYAQAGAKRAVSIDAMAHLFSPDEGVREAARFAMGRVVHWAYTANALIEQALKDQRPDSPLAGVERSPVDRLKTTPAVIELRVLVPAMKAVASLRSQQGRQGYLNAPAKWLSIASDAPARQAVLEVMEFLVQGTVIPAEWLPGLVEAIHSAEHETAARAARVLAAQKPGAELSGKVRAVAADTARPASVRLALLLACGGALAEEEFQLVTGALLDRPHTAHGAHMAYPPDAAATAARILSEAALTPAQLMVLVPLLPQAGLTQRPLLLRAYAAATDETLGLTLVDTLQKSGSLAGLSADDLRECLGKFPASVQERLSAARAALAPDAEKQRARLAELEKSLPAGDAQRGKVVFQSAKASCVLCHQAGYLGKHLGPDLSKIGSIRTQRDLLEAIVFPSASFVRSYEPVEITRKDGPPAYGMIVNESAAAVTLTTGAVTPPVTIPRMDVAAMKPGTASLMPQGIDQILTPQELADVLAFLQSLK